MAQYVSTILNKLAAMFTGSGNTSRLSVDAQPTSFESNEQFKIAHRFNNVSGTSQIVYWFSTVNAVNIMERVIRLKEGKREYLVIPDTGAYESQKALLSSAQVPVRAVNSNLQDSGLDVHPTSLVTVTYGVLSGANRFTIADDDQFPNFDLVGVGTQGNNALNPSAGVDSNMSGVAAGLAFFLVLEPYDNEVTSGQLFLHWEERF
jgi:hypothetical protein